MSRCTARGLFGGIGDVVHSTDNDLKNGASVASEQVDFIDNYETYLTNIGTASARNERYHPTFSGVVMMMSASTDGTGVGSVVACEFDELESEWLG